MLTSSFYTKVIAKTQDVSGVFLVLCHKERCYLLCGFCLKGRYRKGVNPLKKYVLVSCKQALQNGWNSFLKQHFHEINIQMYYDSLQSEGIGCAKAGAQIGISEMISPLHFGKNTFECNQHQQNKYILFRVLRKAPAFSDARKVFGKDRMSICKQMVHFFDIMHNGGKPF